jgi:hypothetical protein
MKRFWTPDEDTKLLELYRTNVEVSEIARRLGRPKGSMSSRLGLLKEPRRPSIPSHKTHPRRKRVGIPLGESRIGTILRPYPWLTIHYAREL